MDLYSNEVNKILDDCMETEKLETLHPENTYEQGIMAAIQYLRNGVHPLTGEDELRKEEVVVDVEKEVTTEGKINI